MYFSYWFPFILIVTGNLFYHIISKYLPISTPPFFCLAITYFISFLACLGIYIFTDHSFNQDLHTINWASLLWGIVLVCIEVGYILLYRAGWKISLAPLLINIIGTIFLLIIGNYFYKELLSSKQILGIIFCFIGLYFLH